MHQNNCNIIHLLTDTSRKFMEPFIKFVNNNFESDKHLFIIIGKNKWGNFSSDNTIYFNDLHKRELFELLDNAEKIIMHSFTSPVEIICFLLKKRWRKKVFWIVWGGDLYQYIRPKQMKILIYGIIRKLIIPDFKGICTLVDGDFELAEKLYNYKGQRYSAIYINEKETNLVQKFLNEKEEEKIQGNTIKILVGNSATPSNCHIEIFKILEKWKDKNICIICPLSYGDKNYGDKVEEEGKILFGDKFIALRSMIPYDQYLKLLSDISIGIFNNNRQQGLGNIYSLISLKKKVYLRENAVYTQLSETDGVKVYSIKQIIDMSYQEFINLDKNILLNNKQIIDEKNSIRNAKRIWSIIFNAH